MINLSLYIAACTKPTTANYYIQQSDMPSKIVVAQESRRSSVAISLFLCIHLFMWFKIYIHLYCQRREGRFTWTVKPFLASSYSNSSMLYSCECIEFSFFLFTFFFFNIPRCIYQLLIIEAIWIFNFQIYIFISIIMFEFFIMRFISILLSNTRKSGTWIFLFLEFLFPVLCNFKLWKVSKSKRSPWDARDKKINNHLLNLFCTCITLFLSCIYKISKNRVLCCWMNQSSWCSKKKFSLIFISVKIFIAENWTYHTAYITVVDWTC